MAKQSLAGKAVSLRELGNQDGSASGPVGGRCRQVIFAGRGQGSLSSARIPLHAANAGAQASSLWRTGKMPVLPAKGGREGNFRGKRGSRAPPALPSTQSVPDPYPLARCSSLKSLKVMLSTRACQEASMMSWATPTVPQRVWASRDSMSTRTLAPVPPGPGRTRTL